MIIKISVSELRGLIASGSAPRSDGANDAASPAGDGKTRQYVSTGRAFRAGSDHDIDRGFRSGDGVRSELETARMVADFNERAFKSGSGFFAKDTTDYGGKVGGYCSSPVYADVPPMPEGFMGGYAHDCPAAVFGRRFSEAFYSWLDAFDCVLRSLPGGDWGGRMLEVESYAVTDTDAVVRAFRLEGGVRRGEGPLIEERVRLKPWCVQGSDCGAYVDGVVSDEVDALVRGLGDALGFDGEQMARVRALVALEERPPRSCGTHGTHDVTGRAAGEGADGKVDGKIDGDEKADEPEMERKREGPGPDFGSRSALYQDYDIDDSGKHVEGYFGEDSTVTEEHFRKLKGKGDREAEAEPETDVAEHAHKERAARGGKVVSDFIRRFGLFADWVEGENGRRLVAETMPSDDWRRLVVSVTDAGTGRLLHACDYELFDENGARITWLTTMNLCLFCLGLCETRFQERMRAEHIDVFPELEGGFGFGGDNKRYNDGGCDGDGRREYERVRVVAETIRGWLDALEGWSCARMPDEVGGLMFRVFPFVDHEDGEAVRGGESVRLICRRCDTYTVFDVERHIPEGYGGMPMLRHMAVGMCAEMALALNGRLPWLDVGGFLRSVGGPDPEFNAEVLKIAGVPECDADADVKEVSDGGHDGARCSGGIDPTAARTREAANLLRERLRRFCEWAGGETSRTLEAPVMFNTYRADVVRSVIRDVKTRETLYDEVFPYCSGDTVETFVEYMRVMTESAVCRKLNLESDEWTDGGGGDEVGDKVKPVKFVRSPKSEYDVAAHAGCVYYATDKEEIIVNGETYVCKCFVRRREAMAHKAAEMIREWLDGLDRWARDMHKERGGKYDYGMSFSVFPSNGGIRLMCHDMDHSFGKADEYAVYDRWCSLPDGVDVDVTDFAALMCVMMADDLSAHEQWMDIDAFLRRDGATPFDARVLEALDGQDGPECDEEDEDE